MDYTRIVEEAVIKFYSTGSKDAHFQLLQFQASPEAWKFVWPLLDSSKPYEVQLFSATTLHAKISKQWEEVPVSEYPVLKNYLLGALTSQAIPKLVLTRLCEAFAIFLGNTYEFDENRIHKVLIDELMELFPCNSSVTLDLLLRVLLAFAVDAEKKKGPKRIKLREQLGIADYCDGTSWRKYTWLLQQVFTTCEGNISDDSDLLLYLLALDCSLSWLKLDPPLDSVAQLYQHFLIAASNYAPSSHDDDLIIESKAWEIVQECITLAITHDSLRKRPQLFWQWARGLVSAAEQKGGTSFATILTALGDTHSRTLLLALIDKSDESCKWTVQTLLELLLECSEHRGRYPTEECCSHIPFGFWYSLQDDLTTLDTPIENEARLALRPVYARLTQALLRKSTLPSTPAEAGNADERELLRCYRQDVSDTIVYCYNVLGNDLLMLLGQRLSQPQIDNQKWTDIESTLYAFQALCDCIHSQESEYVPAIIDLVLSHIPYERYPREVLACACSTVRSYAEWVGENPDPWLERSLQLITLGLTQGSVTATPASMALKDISRECESHLAPLAPSILETISKTLTVVPPGGAEGLRLMYAAGKLLNSLASTEEQLKYLDATLGLCVIRLQELLQHPINNARLAVVNQLKMATMFLSTLEGVMGKSVLEGLLPIFNQIVSNSEWNQDDLTLEAMHNCAQRSLQCLLHPETDARPLLPLLIASYETRPHPAALHLLRQVVLLFSSDTDNLIAPMLTKISIQTLEGLKTSKSSGGNLSDYSDLLEAYLGLLGQICKKTPRLMLQISDQIPEMLRCAIMSLSLPENGVIKAAGTFLINIIGQRTHYESFIQLIGEELIWTIIQCIGGRVPRSNLESHAKILFALNNNNSGSKKQLKQWIQVALVDTDLPVAPGQKEALIRDILFERNRGRLCEILQKFSLQCQRPVIGL
ncbi:hypothetical protein PV325_007812 [Microctonus aethiopoides]|uniref:Importin N-terminal domain-containing protein n=1 Tax=Microctonus aethiopoides TaxID=144406 RepID=A0AA39FWK4_9HYME|nr:hypothetical protein PV325_007812 [Microctonus aethiopoides]KAK0078249.1 hypothetical protein PV326_009479 [Microctonus aethiopoides]KAK0176998.1 hypothetical protein PV328_001093 [Microctonus aethiopoides]